MNGIKTDSLEIDPHIYGQLVFNKGIKTIQWRKGSFQQMMLEQLNNHMLKMTVDP